MSKAAQGHSGRSRRVSTIIARLRLLIWRLLVDFTLVVLLLHSRVLPVIGVPRVLFGAAFGHGRSRGPHVPLPHVKFGFAEELE